MREWSVTVEGNLDPIADLDETADRVLEQLRDYSPAIAIMPAPRKSPHWSITVTVAREDAKTALEAGIQAVLQAVGRAQLTRLEVMTMEEIQAANERPNLPDLVGVTEVAEMLGVSKQRVWELQKTHETFPPIAVDLKAGPVWLRSSVEAWQEAWPRRTGRPALGQKLVLDTVLDKLAGLSAEKLRMPDKVALTSQVIRDKMTMPEKLRVPEKMALTSAIREKISESKASRAKTRGPRRQG